jgi:tetratricopeptide (TPR) repeat protein
MPQWGVTQYWLARCLIAAELPEEALLPARQAHTLEPSHPLYKNYYFTLLHQRALTFQGKGQTDEAVDAAWKAHELDPDHIENEKLLASLLHFHALALQMRGRAPASLSTLEQLHDHFDHEADSRFLHGWAHQSGGSPKQAIPHYEHHLRLYPAHAKARLNLAYALRDLNRKPEAIAELRTLLAADPTNADAQELLVSLE